MSSLGWRSMITAQQCSMEASLGSYGSDSAGLVGTTQGPLPGLEMGETEGGSVLRCARVRWLVTGRSAAAQDCEEAAGKCLCHRCHPSKEDTQSSSHGHILGPLRSPNTLSSTVLTPFPPSPTDDISGKKSSFALSASFASVCLLQREQQWTKPEHAISLGILTNPLWSF